jgi:hypothetical protein
MERDRCELTERINKSLLELYQGMDSHRCLLASILGQEEGEQLPGIPEIYSARARERKLKEAIKEAVEVLEETKKAFKSKRLESLRKRLTQVLMDAD